MKDGRVENSEHVDCLVYCLRYLNAAKLVSSRAGSNLAGRCQFLGVL